jgi:hypothetical protein
MLLVGGDKDTSDGELGPRTVVVSDKQQIPGTRFSSRIQDQMLEKAKVQDNKKKIPFEGTSLNDQNSFVILGNDDIAALANDMGVEICLQHFDTIDLMKDLEVARHALEKQKISAPL